MKRLVLKVYFVYAVTSTTSYN